MAALSYEEYPPEYASYYDFMEELWEEYGTFTSNTEGQEEELLARGEEDGEILRGILEQGATVWVIPKQAENRISYATQLIGEKYGWKAEQLEQLNGYVVYYLWK